MSDRPQTALIHFYRGELGRLAIYRVRLDTTTNWAIGVSVAVLTFALGQQDAPHTLLVLPYLLTTVFLFLESRRFQELHVLQQRIRLMERHFFAPIFRNTAPMPDTAAEQIAASLEDPTTTLPLLQAVSHRLRRNYLWLFLANHGGWWMKIYLMGGSLSSVALGRLPGGAVVGISILLILPWMALALLPTKGHR